jgi:hypothetical protein
MTIQTLLRDAYESEVSFDSSDVAARRRGRQRRRQAFAGVGSVLVLALGIAGVLVLVGDDHGRTVVAGPRPSDAPDPAAAEPQVVGRWLLTRTHPSSLAGSRVPFLRFEADGPADRGTFRLVGGCTYWFGGWQITNGRLTLTPANVTSDQNGDSLGSTCPGGYQVDARLSLAITDHEPTLLGDTIRFLEPIYDIVFERFDALPSAASTDLVGEWGLPGENGGITWSEHAIDVGACTLAFERHDDGLLTGIDPLCDVFSDSIVVPFLNVLGRGAHARLEGRYLYLAAGDDVVVLHRGRSHPPRVRPD